MKDGINELAQQWVLWQCAMFWQVALLGLLVAALDRFFRKWVWPQLRYGLWLLILIKLILPPTLTSPVSLTSPLNGWVQRTVWTEPDTALEPVISGPTAIPLSPSAQPGTPGTPEVFTDSVRSAADPSRDASPAESTAFIPRSTDVTLSLHVLAMGIWLIGVLTLTLIFGGRLKKLRRDIQAASDQTPPARWHDALERTCARLGLRRRPRLVVSHHLCGPAVFGLVRPVLLIPEGQLQTLSATEIDHVLLHELAHIRRRDLWIQAAHMVLLILYWVNPLVWLLRRPLRNLRELCCDGSVANLLREQTTAYRDTLLQTARSLLIHPADPGLGFLGLLEDAGWLKIRLQWLDRETWRYRRLRGVVVALTVLLMACCVLPMAVSQAGETSARASIVDAMIDSDGDGLPDFWEVHKYKTDPQQADSDGDGIADGDWNERREYTYSIRAVMRFMPPVMAEALTNDFQDGRLLKIDDSYIEAEIVTYPFGTAAETISANTNWQHDNAGMSEYLQPGITTNWDDRMREDLRRQLRADGLDIDTMTDHQAVTKVCRWLLDRSRSLDKVFTTFYIHYPEGKPAVYPGLEESFEREYHRDSENYDWPLDEHLEHELLGRGMFTHRTHGSCTSTAVYLTTVLRALGIPTRMVFATPLIDASNVTQFSLVSEGITHHDLREKILRRLRYKSGYTNHTFNEVWVGGHWHRLDYNHYVTMESQPFVVPIQIQTFKDLSEAKLAPTLGVRYAKGQRSKIFTHGNPYTTVALTDQFGPHSRLPNPLPSKPSKANAKPNIFIFYPNHLPFNAWGRILSMVEKATWNKTGRYHEEVSYLALFNGASTRGPDDILILLFSLDTAERVPPAYADLLPMPWSEIAVHLTQGQTVTLEGRARAFRTLVLAAPKAAQLESLIETSPFLQSLADSHEPPERDPSEKKVVQAKLTDDVGIEKLQVSLVGVARHPAQQYPEWWSPDGTRLGERLYYRSGKPVETREGYTLYEFYARVTGVKGCHVIWSAPGGTRGSDTGPARDHNGNKSADLHVYTANQPADRKSAGVQIGIATGPWQTLATHSIEDGEGSYTLESNAIAFGRPYEQAGEVHLPVVHDFNRGKTTYNIRVVCRTRDDSRENRGCSARGGNRLSSATYHFDGPLETIQSFQFQVQPYQWIEFTDVALAPQND